MVKPDSARAVRYRIAFPEPHTHLFHVEMSIPLTGAPASIDVSLPAWTPGSYRVRDFSRHLQDLVVAGDGGAPLVHEKVDKQTWRIRTAGHTRAVLAYRVYAFELTVRTAHLDDRHAYWNGANLCPFVVGEIDRPAIVEIGDMPEGWSAVTSLDSIDGSGRVFHAPDYDTMIDAPFDCGGAFDRTDFEVEGVPHSIVMDGGGNYDLPRLREDVMKIVRAELQMWGGRPPYSRYVFITHCVAEGMPGGGLEHLSSTTLMWNRFRFRPREKYDDFLSLVSHEFFHLWNIKRLRPRELGPFVYGGEVYTRALWIVEGVTSYYDELFMRRAGIWDADQYLKKTAEHLHTIEDTPGRKHQSLEESSFDAWIKYYQRNEHSVNATISYYEKGQLVAWLLDLEIRRASGGARSLDDVMRALYREHPETGPGYETRRFEELAAEAAGCNLEWFFADYVRGVKELDYARHLKPFGIELRWEPKSKDAQGKDGEAEARAWLGARTRTEGPRTFVTEVLEGSPAWRAGVQANDEVLALDGFRVTHDQLDARLHERKPGDKVTLALFRSDRLVTGEAALEARPWAKAALVRRLDADETARRLYEGWLGEPWRAPSA